MFSRWPEGDYRLPNTSFTLKFLFTTSNSHNAAILITTMGIIGTAIHPWQYVWGCVGMFLAGGCRSIAHFTWGGFHFNQQGISSDPRLIRAQREDETFMFAQFLQSGQTEPTLFYGQLVVNEIRCPFTANYPLIRSA